MLLFVLVLSIAVLVLVLGEIKRSNRSHGSASYPEPPRSTIRIAAVQTAIEYEYRFTEYRYAECEYDEIRCDARSLDCRLNERTWATPVSVFLGDFSVPIPRLLNSLSTLISVIVRSV